MSQDLSESIERLSLSPQKSKTLREKKDLPILQKKADSSQVQEDDRRIKVKFWKRVQASQISTKTFLSKEKSLSKQLTFESEDFAREEEKFAPGEDIIHSKKPNSELEEISAGEEEFQMIPTFRRSLKRKVDSEETRQLKQIKLTVTKLENPSEQKVKVKLQPYRRYAQDVKLKAVALAAKLGASKVSAKTGIPESSIRRWKSVGVARLGVSGRKPQFSDLEVELLHLFKIQRNRGISMSNRTLLIAARNIAERRGLHGFVGSPSWLDGFKRRSRICYRRSTRVCQKIKKESEQQAKEFQDQIAQLTQKYNYPKGAIVNADETGIFFDCPSSYTLDFKV